MAWLWPKVPNDLDGCKVRTTSAHPFPELSVAIFPPKRGDAAEMDKRNARFLRQREEVLLNFFEEAKNSSERT